jgi:hypothetical protein
MTAYVFATVMRLVPARITMKQWSLPEKRTLLVSFYPLQYLPAKRSDHNVRRYILNPVSSTWQRDTLCTCDGSAAIQFSPFFLKLVMVG